MSSLLRRHLANAACENPEIRKRALRAIEDYFLDAENNWSYRTIAACEHAERLSKIGDKLAEMVGDHHWTIEWNRERQSKL
jgi:hypothetical protein